MSLGEDDSTHGAISTEPQVELSVCLDNTETLSVRFLQAEDGECKFACPLERSLSMPLGTTLKLVFRSRDLQQPWEAMAKVVFRAESSSGRQYAVRLENLVEMPPVLYALVTRRSTYRVSPGDNERISLLVYTDGFGGQSDGVPAHMKDISVRGVGISLKPVIDAKLAALDTLYLEIDLRATGEQIAIVGRIMNRSLMRDALIYGVEFDCEQTPQFQTQEDRIRRYVAYRQEEELKRADEADIRLAAFL